MTAIHATTDPDPSAPKPTGPGNLAGRSGSGTTSDPANSDGPDQATQRRGPVSDGDPFRSLTAAMRSMIDRVADRIVPTLAPTGLVAFFPGSENGPGSSLRQRLPGHYLIQVATDTARTTTITPILSRAIDTHPPFRRVAAGNGQLWRLDDSLGDLFPPGTRAIGVPINAGETFRAALVLVRPAGPQAFDLDDLLTLEGLVAATTASAGEADPATAVWQPAVLTRSRYVFALRDLLRDLLTADNPYDVARRLARAAQPFFDAESCVVYFVDPSTPPVPSVATGAIPIPPRRRLQLAASVGPGVHLMPPWLASEPAVGPETLFAMTSDGPVLMAAIDPGAVWTEPVRAGTSLLSAIPLRHDGDLIAVLGLCCGESLDAMSLITVENFAFIAAIALQGAQRRSAERTSTLLSQSELARSRLAHDATVAMVGAAHAAGALAAHGAALVPSVADGYVVYLETERIPARPGPHPLGSLPQRGASFRVYSHWRTNQDPAAIATLKRVIDDQVRPLLTIPSLDGFPPEPDYDPVAHLPLFISDLNPVPLDPLPTDRPDVDVDATIRSLAAVPLVRDDITIGALVLVTTNHGRRYGHRDFTFIASLAKPVTRVLATLLQIGPDAEPAREDGPAPEPGDADHADLIAAISVRLIAAQDRSEIYQIIVSALATGLAGWCVIEPNGDDGEPLPATGASADVDLPWSGRLWDRLAQDRCPNRGPSRAMYTGQSDLSAVSTWIGGALEEDGGGPDAVRRLRQWTSLSVAIRHGDTISGVITCLRPEDRAPLTLAELTTVEAVAVIAGTAISAVDRLARLRDENAWLHGLADRRDQVLGQVADAVMVVDGSGEIVFANDRAVALHGRADPCGPIDDYLCRYRPTAIGGTSLTSLTFPTAVALINGETARQTWQFHVEVAGSRTVLGQATPLRDDGGDVTGAVLTMHDVTEEHERYLRRKDSLLALSDDLLAPMTSLKGWSQYLAQRSHPAIDPETAARALEAIGSQTRTLQRLVDRLVAATGPDLGEHEPAPPGLVGLTGADLPASPGDDRDDLPNRLPYSPHDRPDHAP